MVHFRKPASSSHASSSSGLSYTSFALPRIVTFRPGVTTNADVSRQVMAFANHLMDFLGDGESEVSLTLAGTYSSDAGTALGDLGEFVLPSDRSLMLNFLDSEVATRGETRLPGIGPTAKDVAGCSSLQVQLAQCIEAFTRCEELAQEDWVKCAKTGGIQRSTKKLDVWTAPECLLIHLKRFGSEQLYGPVEKVETFVQAPVDFDLSPWIRGPHREKGAQYRLYAVVNHSGSLGFGHYTAYGRVGQGSDRRWYHFNDSTVTLANESDVVSQAAYILFYERVRSTPPISTSASSP